jgi:membrane-bound metal-dependent hydrolase YbcI (DUF457 family)
LHAFAISYLSHIILDMINPRGVPLFWPDPGRDVFPKNPKFRPRSGSKAELVIFGTLIVLFFAVAMPISKYGIASSLRWLLANPASAIQEFKNLQTHSYLDFQGSVRERAVNLSQAKLRFSTWRTRASSSSSTTKSIR